jgi:REP element-mobilizing transposase RayT
LQYRQQHCALRIYAYVILENHMHLIAQSEQLNQQIAQFKSWTARQIIDTLKANRSKRVLKQLNFHKQLHKKDRQYQLWEEGSHP